MLRPIFNRLGAHLIINSPISFDSISRLIGELFYLIFFLFFFSSIPPIPFSSNHKAILRLCILSILAFRMLGFYMYVYTESRPHILRRLARSIDRDSKYIAAAAAHFAVQGLFFARFDITDSGVSELSFSVSLIYLSLLTFAHVMKHVD